MADKQLTKEEFDRIKQGCADKGFGNDPREDAAEYGNETVVVDGKIMPAWMAEVFARLHQQGR